MSGGESAVTIGKPVPRPVTRLARRQGGESFLSGYRRMWWQQRVKDGGDRALR